MKWISVDERRPPRLEPCLYWNRRFGGYLAIADEWKDEDHLRFASHWMPIPEPPGDSSVEIERMEREKQK